MQREIIKIKPDFYALPVIKKVAAYVRVSSGKDAMLHSLSAQISYYSAFIQKNPQWEYVGVYVDEAKTGTKDNRQEFQRLISDCKQGKIDMIITKSISRFARNTLTVLETVRELKNLGIDVYFEKENIHSMSEEGELMLTLLSSFAQEESLSVSENCKWRIRKRFQDGELANLRFMFGYKISNNNIEIDEDNAQIVKWIFEQYNKGIGYTRIAKLLKQMEVKTLHGGPWTSDRVKKILVNEKYSGNALLQKRFVSDHLTKKLKKNNGELPMYYAKGTHIPIIEKTVFDKSSKIMEISRQKVKSSREPNIVYPFTSKIKCLNCGKNYKRKKYNGVAFWNCTTYLEEGKDYCFSKRIPEEILMSKASQVLGINTFDEDIFKKRIKQIIIPNHGLLTFVFNDGKEVTLSWQNKSRSESWTAAKRQAAREQTLERMRNKCREQNR